MESRFSRTEMLIGPEGVKVLGDSTVAVFGLGGVGSYAVEALARAGVGGYALIDFDIVSKSNINRQLHALDDTVGLAKVELMAGRVLKINPSAVVSSHGQRYSPGDGEKFLKDRPDYVVDAIDDMESKVDLIIFCLKEGLPIVSSMGTGNKLDPTLFRVDDISRTSVCPMARSVRTRLKKEGIGSGLKVVFSTEEPRKINEVRDETGRKVPASISFVPPVAGMILAGVVVRDLCQRRVGTKIH
ncbi:MAG: tRNA threonylcarbamoyladenosine dehydratase [Actinobacteria bacterium]|nr:tRNA threonylcarbamoyladenosine dehydratase [Actinomycetota bacterium]